MKTKTDSSLRFYDYLSKRRNKNIKVIEVIVPDNAAGCIPILAIVLGYNNAITNAIRARRPTAAGQEQRVSHSRRQVGVKHIESAKHCAYG